MGGGPTGWVGGESDPTDVQPPECGETNVPFKCGAVVGPRPAPSRRVFLCPLKEMMQGTR